MLEIALAMWLRSMDPSPAQIDALSKNLTHPRENVVLLEHVKAARLAGAVYSVRPNKLLAIAWHESGFNEKIVTREPGHRVSCGPMTPVPKRRCSKEELTLVGGYLAGAKHYRAWLDQCHGSEECADIAYAGGSRSVALCHRGRRVRAPYTHHNVCYIHTDLDNRARTIGAALGE
jgi:hypothetical protein